MTAGRLVQKCTHHRHHAGVSRIQSATVQTNEKGAFIRTPSPPTRLAYLSFSSQARENKPHGIQTTTKKPKRKVNEKEFYQQRNRHRDRVVTVILVWHQDAACQSLLPSYIASETQSKHQNHLRNPTPTPHSQTTTTTHHATSSYPRYQTQDENPCCYASP